MKSPIDIIGNPTLVLRLGGGICFVGHGVLAIGAKAGFITLLSSFGLDQVQAIWLLKAIGCLDILVGLFILLKPNKIVLQWAIAWTTLTIVAWGIHGDSLMDLARRATYMTTPLALLLLLYKREQGAVKGIAPESTNVLTSREPNFVQHPAGIERPSAIANLDLSMICSKLMSEHEGEGWTRQQCDEVAMEYRRFLRMHQLFPKENIVPNLAIDTMWHYHILDTAAYQSDCHAIFGQILHHYPYFGTQGEEDAKQFLGAFDNTKMLYKKAFGEAMDRPSFLASFRIRRTA